MDVILAHATRALTVAVPTVTVAAITGDLVPTILAAIITHVAVFDWAEREMIQDSEEAYGADGEPPNFTSPFSAVVEAGNGPASQYHPGPMVLFIFQANGVTIEEAAARLEMTRSALIEFLIGKNFIGKREAGLLEEVYGIKQALLMRFQDLYVEKRGVEQDAA